MFIGWTLRVEFLKVLFSVYKSLFEVSATDFITGIVVVHHVLVQLLGDLWCANSFTHAARIVATRSSSVSTEVL